MNGDRYSRQIMLDEIGEAGQQRMAAARVLIVGLGGLGSAVATCLTGAGVGTIGLCDADTVSASNLQRQFLYTEAQVGRSKVDEAAARLHAMSEDTEIRCFGQALDADNACDIIRQFDIVTDCTDNHSTRYLIDDTCRQTGTPWVYGSIGEFSGRVSLMNGTRGTHYSDIYPEREALCKNDGGIKGVIGAVPAVVGAIEANEVIKHLCGFGESLDGRLFVIDLKTLQTRIFEL